MSFFPSVPVLLAGDDTVAEHPGPQVFGKGRHRYGVRSTHSYTVYRWGHTWVVIALLVKLPCATRPWELSIVVALYRSPAWDQAHRRRHKTPAHIARLLLARLIRWFPERHFIFVGDTGYGTSETARFLLPPCAMCSRFPSHRQSPPTRACDHARRVGLAVVAAGARRPTDAIAHRSAWVAALRLTRVPAARAPAADGNDNSVPRLDATGATATSAACASRSVRPQPPAVKTAVEFRPRSGGPEPAVRFETGQTGGRQHLRPFLGATSVPVSARTTAKNACAHMAKVM